MLYIYVWKYVCLKHCIHVCLIIWKLVVQYSILSGWYQQNECLLTLKHARLDTCLLSCFYTSSIIKLLKWINWPQTCLYICLYVRMFVCLCACMFTCLYACMFTCLYGSMFACLCVCMFACLHVCITTLIISYYQFFNVLFCLKVWLLVCLLDYLNSFWCAYINVLLDNMFENMNANLLAITTACKPKCLITWIIVFYEFCSGLIFFTALLSLLHESCLNVCKCVCLKTIFLSFSYLFSWLPVSKYVCMCVCLIECSQTCLKTFFCVYKKTLTHVRLTINFIPSDKNISLLCFMFVCMNVWNHTY